jgi:general secretion pathway protein D
VDKVPLLGQIPILGHLFSNDNAKKTKTEIILSITPHIVGNKKVLDAREMEYWSGTDSMLRSDQLVLKPLGEVSLTGSSAGSRTMPPPIPALTSGLAPTAVPAPSYLPANPLAQPSTPSPAAVAPVAPALLPAKAAAPQAAATETHQAADAGASSSLAFSWTGQALAKVGDKITVSLNTKSLQGVKSLNFDVGFDPGVLKAIEVSEGNGMKHNNATSSLSKVIDQNGGDITIDLKGSGASSGGGVVSLVFEVTAPIEGTTITANSITATMENGEAQTPAEPTPFSLTAE